jgi:CRP-like cAMP-binding protein
MEVPHTKQTIQTCSVCSSRSNCIFCDLDDLHITELNQMQQRSVYAKGSVICTEGNQPQGVYIICSGQVKLSIYSSDGRAVIVGIAASGDVLGVKALLSGKPHNLTAETLEMTQLCFIRKDDFLGFLKRNGDVSLRLAQRLSNELYEAYLEVRDVALKKSYQRLAELLLRLGQSYGELTPKGTILKISLSQEELAEMIGTSRRTLTRALTKLRHLGLIEYRHHSIVVLNMMVLGKILLSNDLFD